MAGTTIGEFVLNLVVDAGKGEMTVNGLVASMGELEVASVGEIAILFKLAQQLAELTDHAIKTSLGIEHVTSTTGMSTKSLQEWSNVAEFAGLSGKTMADTLAEISHNLSMGQYMGDYGGLKNLGVLLSKAHISLNEFKAEHPEELLKKIRDSKFFQGLTPAQQYTILSGSGLQGVLEVLQKKRISDTDFKKYVSEGPVLSDKEVKQYDAIYRQMTEIRHLTESIGLSISKWFGPGISEVLSKIVETLSFASKISHNRIVEEVAPTAVENTMRASRDLVLGNGSDLLKMWDDVVGSIGNSLKASHSILVEPNLALASAVGPQRTLILNDYPQVHFHGAQKLSKSETEQAVSEGLKKHHQDSVNLLNRSGF